MKKFAAAFLCLALALLPAACGKPAADLSDFTAAFDLSDLSQFLTEDQLAGVDANLREKLIAQGYDPDSIALQYDAPSNGSVKLPYNNAGGLDLARLDANKLAEHIAGQIVTECKARGIATQTAAPAETTKPTTQQANNTSKATTTTGTTSSKALETKNNKYSPPDQYRTGPGGNLNSSRIHAGEFNENIYSNGMLLVGDYLIERSPYGGDYYDEGLELYVYRRSGNGVYDRIGKSTKIAAKPSKLHSNASCIILFFGEPSLSNQYGYPELEGGDIVSLILRKPIGDDITADYQYTATIVKSVPANSKTDNYYQLNDDKQSFTCINRQSD